MFCRPSSLRGMDTLSGETTLSKLVCLPSLKGSSLKGKHLLPWEQMLFCFREDPFSDGFKGLWCPGKQTESHKFVSLVTNGGKCAKYIKSL